MTTYNPSNYFVSAGSEYGIVLMSTVRSRQLEEITVHGREKKHADIGWKLANLGFITDRHQICVGITRCKYGLVIVGKWPNKETHNMFHLVTLLFSSHHSLAGNKVLLSYDPTWNNLIEHYERNNCVRTRYSFPT